MSKIFCTNVVSGFVKVKSHIFGARKEVSVDFSYSILATPHKFRLQKLLLNQTKSIDLGIDQTPSNRMRFPKLIMYNGSVLELQFALIRGL